MTDLESALRKITYEYEKTIEHLKAKYADLLEKDKDTFAALAEAERLRSKIKIFKLIDKFDDLDLGARIEYVIEQGFEKFFTEFPVVSKYLLVGEYNENAFKRYLTLAKHKLVQSPDNKEDMEDVWVQCQASYIRFLFESKQTHVNKKASDDEWLRSYKALKKEFSDFKKQHEQASVKVQSDINRYKIDKLQEIATLVETRNIGEMKELSELQQTLEDLLFKQNYDKCMLHIKSGIPLAPVFSGWGQNEDAGEEYDEEKKISEYRKRNKFILQ